MQLNRLRRMPSPAARGFTLVELMVAVVIGMILIGSVLALVLANLQSGKAATKGMRATQESRALSEIIGRELRRARYDGSAMRFIGSGATSSTFGAVPAVVSTIVSNATHRLDCVKYAYDENGNGTADSGEFRMFSGAVSGGRGVVRHGQFATSAAVDCSAGQVISSEDIDVECLTFVFHATAATIDSDSAVACFNPRPNPAQNLPAIPAQSFYVAMRMRMPLDANGDTRRRADSVFLVRSPKVTP